MTGKTLHIAIIPDGNRRWAKGKRLHPWKGHEKAIENFRSIAEFCRDDPHIGVLTVWCFSSENWKRDPKEVAMLMKFFEKYLREERVTWQKDKIRFAHSGRKDRMPKSLAKLIEDIEGDTSEYDAFTIHLALDYGGKDEIVRAVRSLISQPHPSPGAEIDEEAFSAHFDHPELPDIDIVIRTSGEMRTSNFFLWQTAYAEWIFLEKYFPDFSIDDVTAALKEFDERQRRFGA